MRPSPPSSLTVLVVGFVCGSSSYWNKQEHMTRIRAGRAPHHSSKQIKMIRPHSQFEDHPALLLAFLRNHGAPTLSDGSSQDRSAVGGAPNEMRDDELDTVFVALVGETWSLLRWCFHLWILHQSHPKSRG